MDSTPDARLARIAARQAGAFNRSQATGSGLSPWMIAIREARGEFRRLDDDVWAISGAPNGWRQACWAATLIHTHAALSHTTGAHELGLDVEREYPIHTGVPLAADHRSRSVEIHRSRYHRYATHDGLRITRFEHVLVQLAGCRSDLLEAALHSGVDRDAQRLDRVFRHLHRLQHSRLPGLRGLLELAIDLEGDAPTQSELERRMFAVVARVPGMPPPHRQVKVPWSPTSTSIVDGAVEDWRLILEADGRRFHERRDAFERDRWRDAEAAVAGYHVIRLTYRRLEDDADGVVDQLTRYGERVRRHAA